MSSRSGLFIYNLLAFACDLVACRFDVRTRTQVFRTSMLEALLYVDAFNACKGITNQLEVTTAQLKALKLALISDAECV